MNPKTCTLDKCSNVYLASGYCSKHYQRWKKYGDPETTLSTPHGEGKPVVDPKGYVSLPTRYGKNHPNARANGHIFEHIYVMSQYLGRPLLPGENVHHKNGQRADNRIENLELWSKSQPSGQRVIDKLQWAVELITSYHSEYPELLEPLKEIL